LLVDVLARVVWTSPDFKPDPLDYYFYLNMIAHGKLEVREWETTLSRKNQYLQICSTEQFTYLLGCLMLSAINDDRVPHQSTSSVRESSHFQYLHPLDFVKKVMARGDNFTYDYGILYSFIAELSREELLDLATMRTKQPVLLSDLPSAWEVFFHAEKGLATMKMEKALKVPHERRALGKIFQNLLKSDDPSLSPEDELRRVLLWERGLVREERVREAMTRYRELPVTEYGTLDIIMLGVTAKYGALSIVAQSARDLWLKDVQLGRNYIMGMVQLYLDIFSGEVESWAKILAKTVPVQLLVVAEEKARRRSGGGQHEWANLLKLVQKCIRDELPNKLTLNGICNEEWRFVRYNRECDWFQLLMVLLNESPERNNYANRTKVYPTWGCSLLRVWIRLFGKEETKRQADEIHRLGCFWKNA